MGKPFPLHRSSLWEKDPIAHLLSTITKYHSIVSQIYVKLQCKNMIGSYQNKIKLWVADLCFHTKYHIFCLLFPLKNLAAAERAVPGIKLSSGTQWTEKHSCRKTEQVFFNTGFIVCCIKTSFPSDNMLFVE